MRLYLLHDRCNFCLAQGQFIITDELDHAFKSAHVHELNHLLDESLFEEASVKLYNVFAILAIKIFP